MKKSNHPVDSAVRIRTAAFGAGCFWHVEEEFGQLQGVVDTAAGYMGGHTKNPTYKDVCSNTTGHIETVLIEYDPSMISYDQLLEKFFSIHNPTSKDRQGPDIGVQYRSVIFYYDEQQRRMAHDMIRRLEISGTYKMPIVTQVLKAKEFYKAEEYHQRYLMKRSLKDCSI